MSERPAQTSEEVLVLAPAFNDAELAVGVLCGAGIQAIAVETLGDLYNRMRSDCGAVVVSIEGLQSESLRDIQRILEEQEAWSDLPIILLTSSDVIGATEVFSTSGNISLLERPFARLTLIRSVEVALRARRKQYEVRALLNQQSLATQKRDEFFASLSHELRTPLNIILGWIEILQSGKLDSTCHSEALETLGRNARMQKGLIDDLLDISRIVTGKMQIDLLPISLTELIRSTTASFLPRAQEKAIALEFMGPKEDLPVMGDEQRLVQVISNLLTNAIKFTPPEGRISVSVEKLGAEYKIAVQDSGQGVEADFLPFMFDRLKQEDMSTTRSHGGLGLGLAIASHIVSEHNGVITAESEGRGCGMKVTVTLPAMGIERKIAPKSSVAAVENQSLKGIKVLVVDDSPDILRLINLWLGRADAEVRLTASGEEALTQLGVFKPHILLSDIGMPDMDGYQLISKVRSLPNGSFEQLPAVALTAYARNEERVRAIDAGFQMHISKPISSHQLVSAIAALVY